MNLRKKEMFWSFWLPLTAAILLYCTGDVLLKTGNIEIGSTLSSLFQGNFWTTIITNIPIIIAFALALVSRLIVGYILSKNPFGLTEGIFISVSVVLTFILGIIIFNETIRFSDIMAISIITIGILLVYSSESYQSANQETSKEPNYLKTQLKGDSYPKND